MPYYKTVYCYEFTTECTHNWAVVIQGRLPVNAIYIDFSPAFDSVVRSNLIFKLTNYGISRKLLLWI